MGKAIRLLTSHMKVTRTVRCNIHKTTRGDIQRMQVPATIDNGADTFMFGSDFRILNGLIGTLMSSHLTTLFSSKTYGFVQVSLRVKYQTMEQFSSWCMKALRIPRSLILFSVLLRPVITGWIFATDTLSSSQMERPDDLV